MARPSLRTGIRASGSQWLLIPETKNMSLQQIQHFLQYGDDPANRPNNPDTDGLQSLIDPVRAVVRFVSSLRLRFLSGWRGCSSRASLHGLAVRCEPDDALFQRAGNLSTP